MLSHPYLNARVSLLAGQLLTPENLDRLIGQEGQDTSQAETGVRLAALFDGQTKDTGQATQLLLQSLLRDFLVLLRPLHGKEREFLLYWLRKFETANLKFILRAKLTGLAPDKIRAGLTDLGPFSRLPLNALLQTEDLAELLRLLETSTPYAEAARQTRRIYAQQTHNPFMLEATLEHRYLSGLLHRAGSLESGRGGELTALADYLLDRYNLIWLLRCRFTYHLSPAETLYLLIPGVRPRLSGHDITMLAGLHTLEEALEKLPDNLRPKSAGAPDLTVLELTVEEAVREAARKTVKLTVNGLARAFAYLILRECEMNRLLAIFKGKALGLSPAVIRAGAGLGDFH